MARTCRAASFFPSLPILRPEGRCALKLTCTDSREELVLLFTHLPCALIYSNKEHQLLELGHREADRVRRKADHQRDPEFGRACLAGSIRPSSPQRGPF